MKSAKRPNSSQKLGRVIAKNTPLSLPLKGTSLLTRSLRVSLKTATDEISTDSRESTWWQTQAAQCLATQDNKVQNNDQCTPKAVSVVPEQGGKDWLNLFLKRQQYSDKLRKKNKNVPPVTDKVDKNYTQTFTKKKRSTKCAWHTVGPDRRYLMNEWMNEWILSKEFDSSFYHPLISSPVSTDLPTTLHCNNLPLTVPL